jgi:hypothetical protein
VVVTSDRPPPSSSRATLCGQLLNTHSCLKVQRFKFQMLDGGCGLMVPYIYLLHFLSWAYLLERNFQPEKWCMASVSSSTDLKVKVVVLRGDL